MRLQEARRDLYRKLAKEQGYKSRAAFKLIEANEKYDFIHEGDKVVDLGSAPGGWLQVAASLTGPRGIVVGVDLSDVRLRGEKTVTSITMDVDDPSVLQKVTRVLGGKADVLLSDLSPSVSGVWEIDQSRQADLSLRAVDLSRDLLGPGGRAFFKLFEGERAREVREAFKSGFATVRVLKPAASRSASAELYYYCERPRARLPASAAFKTPA